MLDEIILKIDRKIPLTKQDAVTLLRTENTSSDLYKIMAIANEFSRKQYNNRAYVFAQIGINSAPCSGNCKFCSLAKDSFSVDAQI